MIVELIGCAGAGKTTLARLLCEHGIAGRRTTTLPGLVLDRPGLRRLTHPTLANLVQETASLPYFLASAPRHRAFLSFATRTIVSHAPSTFQKLNGVRSIVRRVGMYQLAKRGAAERVVLADEGTVLTAYHLFVMTGLGCRSEDAEQFARLVPLPDRVVYVRAPVGTLLRRAAARPELRRQFAGKAEAEIEATIRRTVEVFDCLAAAPSIADRVLVVENDDRDGRLHADLVAELAERLQPGAPAPDASANGFQLQPEVRP